MLTLQEISDRLEITDVLVRYSHAVDTGQWQLLGDVFTADAVIDYTAMGGPHGTLDEISAFLSSTMPRFPAFQHLIANSSIVIDGDTATARTMCHNPMVLPGPDDRVLFCGLWYIDELRRVDGVWRISRRVEEKSYMWPSHP